MSAKELVLIAKDKYNGLMNNRKEAQLNSSSTQTDLENDSFKNISNHSSDEPVHTSTIDKSDIKGTSLTNKNAKKVRHAIRAPLDQLPGTEFRAQKTTRKKVINWIPF